MRVNIGDQPRDSGRQEHSAQDTGPHHSPRPNTVCVTRLFNRDLFGAALAPIHQHPARSPATVVRERAAPQTLYCGSRGTSTVVLQPNPVVLAAPGQVLVSVNRTFTRAVSSKIRRLPTSNERTRVSLGVASRTRKIVCNCLARSVACGSPAGSFKRHGCADESAALATSSTLKALTV